MLEWVVAAVCIALAYWWFFVREAKVRYPLLSLAPTKLTPLFFPPCSSKVLFQSSANMPSMTVVTPSVGTAAPTEAVTSKKIKSGPRSTVDLSQRAGVVLYGTLTGTSKVLAQKLVAEAKRLFDLEVMMRRDRRVLACMF